MSICKKLVAVLQICAVVTDAWYKCENASDRQFCWSMISWKSFNFPFILCRLWQLY